MDTKVKLRVQGLTNSQIQAGAYALILAEEKGFYRIPIIVGTAEAQSIAIALEHITPPRPLTHDLFVALTRTLGIQLREVYIYKFQDGVFYSELIFDKGADTVRLDSRTSDAIAIALRVNCSIYTSPEIVKECGVVLENGPRETFTAHDEDEYILNLEPEDIHDEEQLKRWLSLLDKDELGFLGIAIVLGVAYWMSYDRKRIDWKLVGAGLLMQLLFALAVLYVPVVGIALEWIGKIFVKLMDFTQEGVQFLLGPLIAQSKGFIFLLNSLPVVIFFSALVSLFYHWGIIQWVVSGMSWLLRRFLRISGAEGLVVSGNVFLGMTEAPVLIKNYLPKMNRSELFLVMVAGMGTIAGTVMATYIGMLAGGDQAARVLFAKHLLSASLMAAPGAIVLAKIICPQTEQVDERLVKMEHTRTYSSVLGALAAGTSTGVRLMVNIAAMLLVFIALVAMANYLLEGVIGRYTGLNEWIQSVSDGKAQGLTFQLILGVLLAPFMWLIGIPYQDMLLVGSLLGQKTILNEFVAYFQLQEWKEAGMFVYQKSILMSTYLLCGFANISSIGILLGGMGVLAPEKRELITRLGVPAMVGGALVSVLSATIIGMILGN